MAALMVLATNGRLDSQAVHPLVAELVADIRPGGSSNPGKMRVFEDALYFAANDGVSGTELWRLDATGAWTMVMDISPGAASSSPDQLTVVGDRLFFTASTPATGVELWQYDGVNPPALAADVRPGPTNGDLLYLTAYGDQLVFRANDGVIGDELFAYAGNQLRPLNIALESATCPAPDCDSDPYGLTVHDGVLYSAAAEAEKGFQVFRYNGTDVQPVTTNLPGGPTGITGLGGLLVFGALDFGQYRPYSVEIATGVVTKLSNSVMQDALFTPGARPVLFSNRIYFPANDGISGEELWVTDGLPGGTRMVADLNPSLASSLPRWLTPFNGELYFSAIDPVSGSEPFAFSGQDGTTPRPVADINPGPLGSSFNAPAVFGPYLVFEAIGEAGLRPWITEGSAQTTGMARTAAGGLVSVDNPRFVLFNEGLYFQASDGVSGNELWRIKSAATATTTVLGSSPNPSIVGGQVTFSAFVTGGSPTGTVTFFDGATPMGSATVAGGIATFQTAALGLGSHSITATYDGDAVNAPSTSNTVLQIVADSSAQPPVAFPQTVTTAEDVPVGITLTGADPNGDAITFEVVSLPTRGTLSGVPPNLIYTPASNAFGPEGFTFKVSDGLFGSPTVTVSIVVTPVNDPPVVVDDAYPTPVDSVLTITAPGVLANDVDVDSPTLTTALVTGPSNGTLTLNANGSFTYSPAAAFAGLDSFTYRTSDGAATSGLATVRLTVEPPSTFTWELTGSMSSRRSRHTATLLPNGKVLVAGGYGGGDNALNTAELYDPATGSATGFWSSTGRLNTSRARHTATLLRNGSVLVTAGVGSGGSDLINSSELYDPATGTWTYTGDLNRRRVNHTATLLPDGRVLVAGGLGTSGVFVANAEIYNPATGAWTPAAAMRTPRFRHTATLLLNGKVLVTAGISSDGETGSAELYDPVANSWTATGGSIPRINHTATILPSGKVLVAAGVSRNVVQQSAEVYDPVGGTWTATGQMNSPTTEAVAALLPNGKVMVAGGNPSRGVELYDPASGIWGITAALNYARGTHTITVLPNGDVLAVGGAANQTAERYVVTKGFGNGSWNASGDMTTPRGGFTVTPLPDGRLLAAGGGNNFGLVATADVYDPRTGKWTATAPLAAVRASHAAVRLPDGRVLVVGGRTNGGELGSAERYEPASGAWSPARSLLTPRTDTTATLLPNGLVLVVGGGTTNPTLGTAELYNPATDTWAYTGSLTRARSGHTATLLANGQVLVAGGRDDKGLLQVAETYDPATGLWTPTANMNLRRGSHTALLLADGSVLVAGGDGPGGPSASAEVYTPATRTWTAIADMAKRRTRHTATLLPNGKVLVAGSGDFGSVSTGELFDPVARSWGPTGSMLSFREGHVAAPLPNGKVLAVGGTGVTGLLVNTSEVYTP